MLLMSKSKLGRVKMYFDKSWDFKRSFLTHFCWIWSWRIRSWCCINKRKVKPLILNSTKKKIIWYEEKCLLCPIWEQSAPNCLYSENLALFYKELDIYWMPVLIKQCLKDLQISIHFPFNNTSFEGCTVKQTNWNDCLLFVWMCVENGRSMSDVVNMRILSVVTLIYETGHQEPLIPLLYSRCFTSWLNSSSQNILTEKGKITRKVVAFR